MFHCRTATAPLQYFQQETFSCMHNSTWLFCLLLPYLGSWPQSSSVDWTFWHLVALSSEDVALVLSLKTALVSPQFHIRLIQPSAPLRTTHFHLVGNRLPASTAIQIYKRMLCIDIMTQKTCCSQKAVWCNILWQQTCSTTILGYVIWS